MTKPTTSEGLIFAHLLDGSGGSRSVEWPAVRDWNPGDGVLWVHFDRDDPRVHEWVREQGGEDEVLVEALLADGTRPRIIRRENELLVILRGVNLNPGADPDDMVSVRLWARPDRLVSLVRYRILAAEDVAQILETEGMTGPMNGSQLLVALVGGLAARVGPIIEDEGEAVDELEERIVLGDLSGVQAKLSDRRRGVISLNRYLGPQRAALQRLAREPADWLAPEDVRALQESANLLTRYVEDLEALRAKAVVVQDELSGVLASDMNRALYLLSVVTVLFVPLGFVTGLLGINVGGMPGVDQPVAFWVVCGILVSLLGVEVWILRRLRR